MFPTAFLHDARYKYQILHIIIIIFFDRRRRRRSVIGKAPQRTARGGPGG